MNDLDALLGELGGSASPTPTPVATPVATNNQADDLDSLLAGLGGSTTQVTPKQVQPVQTNIGGGGDDLDSLLAGLGGGSTTQVTPQPVQQVQPVQTNVGGGGDDLDSLLAGLGGSTTQVTPQPVQQVQPVQTNVGGGGDDLDSLLAGLGGGSTTQTTQVTPKQVQPVQTNVGGGGDDLDSLLAGLGGGSTTQTTQATPKTNVGGGGDDLDSLMAGLTIGTTASTTPNQPSASATPNTNIGGGNLDAMLSGLQNEMSGLNTNTNTSAKVCHTCKSAIYGEVIQAMGKFFHPEHFACGNCGDPLGTRNFYEVDGNPQCERCYTSVGCAKCAFCQKPVLDRCITALNQKWHVEHFNCTKCLQPFPDGQFYERDSKPWCKSCFHGQFSYKCGGCSNSISGDVVNALGQQWHPQCFVCSYCKAPFSDGMFFEKDKKPYCKTHYNMSAGATCAGCGSNIQGRVVEAFGKKYHPEHFVCSFCMNPLGGGSYTEQEGKPYCTNCSKRLF